MNVGILKTTREIDGSVKFSKWFREESWIVKADLLKDWIYELTNEYNNVLKELENDDAIRENKKTVR